MHVATLAIAEIGVLLGVDYKKAFRSFQAMVHVVTSEDTMPHSVVELETWILFGP